MEFNVKGWDMLVFRIKGSNLSQGAETILKSSFTLRKPELESHSYIIPSSETIINNENEIVKLIRLDVIDLINTNSELTGLGNFLTVFGYFAFDEGVNEGETVRMDVSYIDSSSKENTLLITSLITPNNGSTTIGTLSTFSPQVEFDLVNLNQDVEISQQSFGADVIAVIDEYLLTPLGQLKCTFFPNPPSSDDDSNSNDPSPANNVPRIPIFTTRIPCPTTEQTTEMPAATPPLSPPTIIHTPPPTTPSTTAAPTTPSSPTRNPALSTLPIFPPTSTLPPDSPCQPTCNVLNF